MKSMTLQKLVSRVAFCWYIFAIVANVAVVNAGEQTGEWIFVEQKTNDAEWQKDLEDANKNQWYQSTVSPSANSVTSTRTQTSPTDSNFPWLIQGATESGIVEWTDPPKTIKPNEEFSSQISTKLLSGTFKAQKGNSYSNFRINESGALSNWGITIQLASIDEKGNMSVDSKMLSKNNSNSLAIGPENKYQPITTTVYGKFPAGRKEGERRCVHIIANGTVAGLGVRTRYIYEWRAAKVDTASNTSNPPKPPKIEEKTVINPPKPPLPPDDVIEIVKDEPTLADVVYPSVLTLLTLAATADDNTTAYAALNLAQKLLNDSRPELTPTPPPTPKQTLNFIDGDGVPLRFELDPKTNLWHDNAGIAYEIDPTKASEMQKEMDELRAERAERYRFFENKRIENEQAHKEDAERYWQKRREEGEQSIKDAEQNRLIREKLNFLNNRINVNAKGDAEDSYLRRLQGHIEKALNEPGISENVDPQKLMRISAAYDKYNQGIIGDEKDRPKPESFYSLMKQTMINSAEDVAGKIEYVARGESLGAIGYRVGAAIATAGASEFLFAPAQALATMHDYVEQGGDDWMVGGLLGVKQVLIDELIGRAIAGAIGKVGKFREAAKAGDVLAKAGNKAVKAGGKAAGVLDDAAKIAQKNADDAIKVQKKANLKNPETTHNTAFEKGQEAGRAKAYELKAAADELGKHNIISDVAQKRFDDAMIAVQSDKYAQNAMNRFVGDNANQLRAQFNARKYQVQQAAAENMQTRIAQESNVPLTDTKIVNASNNMSATGAPDASKFANRPSAANLSDPRNVPNQVNPNQIEVDWRKINKHKISFDNDITVRVRQCDPLTGRTEFCDVHKDITARIYNEEFYKACNNGKLPTKTVNNVKVIDNDAIKKFAKDMDQTAIDFRSADAYGAGDRDLRALLSDTGKIKHVSDIGAVAKTMEHKSYEWFKDADELLHAARQQADPDLAWQLRSLAEGYRAEGVRQTTKQFKNLVLEQAAAINRVKAGTVKIPEKLRTSMAVLERVGQDLSPSDAEKILKNMGTNVNDVIQQSSALMEGMQKMAK